MQSKDIEIIFDNGGGITIQTDEFVHNYDDAADAARDVRGLIQGANPNDWDGNEPECRIIPTDDQIRNGGYKVMEPEDFDIGAYEDSSWSNVREFQAAYLANG